MFKQAITQSPEQRQELRNARMTAMLDQVRAQPKRDVVMGGSTSGQAVEKIKRAKSGKTEKAHKARLVLLGCMVCRRIHGPQEPGAVELHHLRGGGWGKGDWTTLIPLCPEHHRGATGVHGLGTKGFPAHYGFDQADLLADARQLSGWRNGT